MAAARRLLVLAAIMAAAAACRDEPPPRPPAGVAVRFIEHASNEAPSPDRLYSARELFRWPGPRVGEPAGWRLSNVAVEDRTSGRAGLRPLGAGAAIERAVGFEAGDIDRIEVRLSGGARGPVRLWWAGPLQRFSEERSATADGRIAADGHGKLARFELSSHPWWTGRIARLRLDPFGERDETVVLQEVAGVQRAVDAELLAAAAARPWKVELEADARSVLLGPPGRPLERSLVVPEGAELRLGYALQRGVRRPVRFEVTVRDADSPPRRVLEDRLDPRLGEGRRWRDATIPLDAWSGRRVTIVLSTRSDPAYDAVHGLPLWANPEVVGGPPPDRPNLVLICLDTLRADRLSAYGHELPTSPRLDGWAATRAARFATVVATAPWTLPSHVSMFTGLDAVRHGVNHEGPAPESLDMLAERLRDAGYTTAAITGGGYLRPAFALDQGFDRFAYWPDEDTEDELETGMDRALGWLERERARPFFLFFHTYEVHYPHRRRQPFFDRLAGAELPGLPASHILMESHGWRGLRAPGDYFTAKRRGERSRHTPLDEDELRLLNLMYDSAVSYADFEVGRLLDRLDELGLTGRTVVVVTSDHGEALGEKGRAGHSYLEDYNTLVPLLVELPGGRGAGVVVGEQVRLTDLTPTLLDAVGLPVAGDGVSLLHLVDGEPSRVPEQAWTYAPSSNRGLALRLADRLKYTYNDTAWEQIHGEERLIDLERDPAELHDLAPQDPRAELLREATTAELLDQHRGVRIAIRNAGPFLLKGRLRGALATHDRLKSGEQRRSRVRWRDTDPPTFVVEPGGELVLMLASPDRRQAGIDAHLVEEDGRRHTPTTEWFDLGELAQPVAIELAAGAWRRVVAPGRPPDTGVVIWWQGGLPETAVAETDTDDQALEQLRALGYVR